MSAEPHADLVEVQQVQGITLVRFTRRTILDPLIVHALGDRLMDLVRQQESKKFILDFARVESLTSAMLGKFAALQTTITQVGGQIVCCNVGDFLKHIFQVCYFPQSIPIHDNEESAVQALLSPS
jgi:anti-anti-sigma factor